jgi:hypothetical protein
MTERATSAGPDVLDPVGRMVVAESGEPRVSVVA